jgi:hypothetical protein
MLPWIATELALDRRAGIGSSRSTPVPEGTERSLMIRAARRIAVAAACVTAVLPLAFAGATPPTVEVMPYDLVEVIAPGEPLNFDTNPCPFAVTLHHQGTFVYRTFVDRDGTPVRQLVRSAHFTETYSANGRSLTTISVAPAHLRATDGELAITATGNLRHVIVPGLGPVLAQAGRFGVDPETGSLTAAYGLNIPAGSDFCAALSG